MEEQLKENDLPVVLSTEKASAYINRKPQTLRKWACLDNAPNGIRPIRINGRLSWKVSDLKVLLEGGKSLKRNEYPISMDVGNLDPKDFPSIEDFAEPYPPLRSEEITEYSKCFPDIDPKQYPILKAFDIKPVGNNK